MLKQGNEMYFGSMNCSQVKLQFIRFISRFIHLFFFSETFFGIFDIET